VKVKGRITNREYQQLCGIKERLTTIELNDLVSKGIFEKYGTTGRGTYYTVLKAQKPQESRTKGAKEFSKQKKQR
jgi:ATP-dependent DNA helicase RecG